jgi:hypothetical protein
MKSGVFRDLGLPTAGSGRVPGRCLPYDVSVESFEETDTARNSRIREEAWPQGVVLGPDGRH